MLFGFFDAPWCAMGASDWARKGKVIEPIVWSARARDFAVKGYVWKLSDIIYNRYTIKPGDYRVKTRRGGNHVDVFVSWDTLKKEGIIIGANVGDAVTYRKVSLQTMVFDGTTHITEVSGFYPITTRTETKQYEIIETQEIHATWYGKPFHGRRTASGEIYDMNLLTAAHKDLPFGTVLIVENKRNGKTVKVTINDRCPKVGILDLSKEAARQIGIGSEKVLMHILR